MLRLSREAGNLAANAVMGAVDGGVLRIYGGLRPVTPETPVTDQPLIAEIRFGDPACLPAAFGMVDALPMTGDPSAKASAAPTWFRVATRAGLVLLDGDVGQRDADLVVPVARIERFSEVLVSAFRYRQPLTLGGD